MNYKPDILFIIKTIGLEYDDRVRKECNSLKRLKKKVLILFVPDDNKIKKGITGYGVPFVSISLFTRKIFPHKKFLLFKTIEIYIRSLIFLIHTKPKIVWIHNIETAGMVPILWVLKKWKYINKFIWDQHEMFPDNILFNHKIHKIINFLFRMTDHIIVANNERKDFLLTNLNQIGNSKIKVLENFPDQQFADLPRKALPADVEEWLDGSSYLLAQGGAKFERYFFNLAESIIETDAIKCIFVGPYNERDVEILRKRWNKRLDRHLYFTGMVKQMDLAAFIDHALSSIVLYTRDTTNCLLCAPNRMYQAALRGTMLLVGSNPPMANFVRKSRSGIVLEGDGRDKEDIKRGIQNIVNEKKRKNNYYLKEYLWEEQDKVIYKMVNEPDSFNED
ncbi:MAG TPA: hypothetical protein ENN33_05390 [Ignavibacteria bacterium]|nr:hypothetical protein [Ignavibacteria bacterium]